MNRISYQERERVGVLTLDDGKANVIQQEFLEQLGAALDQAERGPVGAVLLSGRPGFFSGGLDLKTLPGSPPAQVKRTVAALCDATIRLFTFPKPVVAAVTGHAIAGGILLAMACDKRIAAEGPFKAGLTEVAMGIALPSFLIAIAEAAVPVPHRTSVILHGETFSAQVARERGLYDALFPPDRVLAEAEREAARLAELPSAAYAETKRRMRGELLKVSRAALDPELDLFFAALKAQS